MQRKENIQTDTMQTRTNKRTGHQQNIQEPPKAETNRRDELHGEGGGQNLLTLRSSIEVFRGFYRIFFSMSICKIYQIIPSVKERDKRLSE